MKILLLGTGTPAPSLRRQSSSYLIQVGSDVIVMDHGPGAHHRLLEAGYRSTDVTHLFLSHLHYDHILDYPRLLMQRWDMGAGKIPELMVYGPEPLERLTEQIIGPTGFLGPDIDARLNHRASQDVFESRGGVLPRKPPRPIVKEIRVGDVIEHDNWSVRVGKASHVQPFLECLAYRLEAAEGSVVYSGDSGGAPDEMVSLARECDVLIHMCHFPTGLEKSEAYRLATGNHMDIAEIAARANVGLLVLSHLIPLLDRPGVKERLLSEIKDVFVGPVILGEDLMEVPLRLDYPPRVD
ncbi:MAG TPA: MBL fold metallo-hydrolase [Vicinamibacteria bacterium]|nr:MBL fold metallo-hydrolase [Vicinamibacteria bacterium]